MKPWSCEAQWQSFCQVQWGPNVTVSDTVSLWYNEANLTVSYHQKFVSSAPPLFLL